MFNYLKKATYVLSKEYHKKLYIILAITLISTVIELLGIGMIIPILSIFVDTDYLKYIHFIPFLENKSKNEIFVIILLSFLLLYFFKFILLRYLIHQQNSLGHKIYTDVAKKIFRNYLHKDFFFHVKNNSSVLIRNIQSEINLYSFGVIFPGVRLISEIIVFLSITIMLMIFNLGASIIVILFFSTIGYFLIKSTNTRLKHWGDLRQYHSALILKQLQQSFQSIREIIINNLQDIFLKKFHFHNLENAQAGKKRDTTVQMPRLILELLGVLTFVTLIFFLLYRGIPISEIFVIIGVFFFAAVRLLPGVSKIVNSVQSLRFNTAVIELIYDELIDCEKNSFLIESQNNKTEEERIKFEDLKIKNLSFSYPGKKNKVLDKVNFEIIKNDKIGIIGNTGVGKSTLLNLITGLIKSNQGEIIINKKSINLIKNNWQKIIGYVPQQVSIIDESILFNVTLERDKKKINFKKLDEILKILDLYDYVYSLSDNIYERVGERMGEKFSGGQSQRLGIARVLYKDPQILIMDEATNALDEKTENFILKKLFSEITDKTILTISHRKNSLRFCDKVIEVKNAKLHEVNMNTVLNN